MPLIAVLYLQLVGGLIMENKMFCYQCQETAGCKGL